MDIVDSIIHDMLAGGPAPAPVAPPKPTTRPGTTPAPSKPLPGTRPTIPTRRPNISPRPKARYGDEDENDVRPAAKASDVSHFTSAYGSNTPYFGEAEGSSVPVPPPSTEEDDMSGPTPPPLPKSRARGLAAMRQKKLSHVPGYKNPYGPHYSHSRSRRLGAV